MLGALGGVPPITGGAAGPSQSGSAASGLTNQGTTTVSIATGGKGSASIGMPGWVIAVVAVVVLGTGAVVLKGRK